MDFHKLLGKIRELEQPTQKTSVVTESVVMEKAVSKSQQQAAGAALAAKKSGDTSKLKGASKEMAKMSKTELDKIASTKHKGLPKKKTDESQVLDTDEEIAEVFDADAKVGDKKKTSSGVATKTAAGMRHEKTYAKDADDSEDKPKAKKKVKEEMKVGDTKKSSTGGTIEKTKTGVKHTAGKNYGGKAAEDEDKKKVKESAKPDFLDVDGDGDKKEPMKKAAAEKGSDKKDSNKGMSDKQAKYFGKKKAVKESVEQTLSFKDCIKLVRESGGQQQIDPLDKELFSWAQRVASSKFTEGVKQDAFAGLTYERFGGRFALHDVLSEDQK
jgi:hypothetical protein